MPERLPTSKPDVMVGSVLTSGDPNTGQLTTSWGGSKTVMRMSGVVGPDVNLWVGGGRLDTIQLHPGAGTTMPAASGIPITFYDSAVAVSGGPLNTSGHKIILKIHPALFGNVPSSTTFQSGALQYGSPLMEVGHVFTSGLCVAVTSGQAGWTATFTPVVSA